jgi:hypothetical protein
MAAPGDGANEDDDDEAAVVVAWRRLLAVRRERAEAALVQARQRPQPVADVLWVPPTPPRPVARPATPEPTTTLPPPPPLKRPRHAAASDPVFVRLGLGRRRRRHRPPARPRTVAEVVARLQERHWRTLAAAPLVPVTAVARGLVSGPVRVLLVPGARRDGGGDLPPPPVVVVVSLDGDEDHRPVARKPLRPRHVTPPAPAPPTSPPRLPPPLPVSPNVSDPPDPRPPYASDASDPEMDDDVRRSPPPARAWDDSDALPRPVAVWSADPVPVRAARTRVGVMMDQRRRWERGDVVAARRPPADAARRRQWAAAASAIVGHVVVPELAGLTASVLDRLFARLHTALAQLLVLGADDTARALVPAALDVITTAVLEMAPAAHVEDDLTWRMRLVPHVGALTAFLSATAPRVPRAVVALWRNARWAVVAWAQGLAAYANPLVDVDLSATRPFVEASIPFQGSRLLADLFVLRWGRASQQQRQPPPRRHHSKNNEDDENDDDDKGLRDLLASLVSALDAHPTRLLVLVGAPDVAVPVPAADATVSFWSIFNQVRHGGNDAHYHHHTHTYIHTFTYTHTHTRLVLLLSR